MRYLNHSENIINQAPLEGITFYVFRLEYYENQHTIGKLKVDLREFYNNSVEEDAAMRDFKLNSIYYDIGAAKVVDPLGGIADVE